MERQELDRRAFVMGSFGFGMAVLGGGMLSGCAVRDEPVPAEPAGGETGASAAEAPLPEGSSAGAEEPQAGKALVAVFSHSGTTMQVAERIAEATGADLFRIETTDVWPDDYSEMTSQVQREQDEGYLPPLAAAVSDWDAYDTVYLGHPIWWNQLPHVMRAFLLQHDLAGKTVAPFCTSGGSGIEGALADVRAIYPDFDLREGLVLTRGSLPGSLDAVHPWLERVTRS